MRFPYNYRAAQTIYEERVREAERAARWSRADEPIHYGRGLIGPRQIISRLAGNLAILARAGVWAMRRPAG